MAGIAFDLDNVLSFFLKNNIDTRGKGVMAAILSLSLTVPETSLVVWALLADLALALIGEFPTRHVNKGKISGFNYFRVFLLLFGRSIPSEVLGVNFTNT